VLAAPRSAGRVNVDRRDSYDDQTAPDANSLVPAASAVVTDEQGRLLLHRRQDKGCGHCRVV
jgi:hypothetical protein